MENYTVRINGNIEDRHTLFVETQMAHADQVEDLFKRAIRRARDQPEVFGPDFRCQVRINIVKDYTDTYRGYGFVWVSNSKIYHALLGYDLDGTERKGTPLLALGKYMYDECQLAFMEHHHTDSKIPVSPAFVDLDKPACDDGSDPNILFARNIPNDLSFLKDIYNVYSTHPHHPRIKIVKNKRDQQYNAIIEYKEGTVDAHFAIIMMKKMHLLCNKTEYLVTTSYNKKRKVPVKP